MVGCQRNKFLARWKGILLLFSLVERNKIANIKIKKPIEAEK
jgi:hypothetical protein